MRTTSISSLSLLLTTAAAAAQQSPGEAVPRVTATTHSEHRAASAGDEGAHRYGGAPGFDPTRHMAQPMPDASRVRATPAGFENRLVSFDVTTGVETIHQAPDRVLPDSMSIAGSAHTGQEPNHRAWAGAPALITSTAFPWSANARVFFNQSGVALMCSATLIDPRVAITSGNCVHEGSGGAWSSGVRVMPGWDGDDGNYGFANATSLASFTGWTTNSTLSDNMGFVRFDRPVGVLAGWFGYGFNNDNAFFTSNFSNMAGYPSNGLTGAPDALYYVFGQMDNVTAGQMDASVSWGTSLEGVTGAGNYVIESGIRTVYGNFATEDLGASTATWTRLTQSKFNFLDATVVGGTYGAALDLVPLNVTGMNDTARAGGTVEGVNFDGFNNSTEDPANATYTGDIYLSTNDNISTFDTLVGSYSFTHDFGPKTSLQVDLPTIAIPADVAAGTYYLGVINTTPDANVGNDDTDGFDAFQITVEPFFNLPTTTLDASGAAGVVVDFDSLGGSVPSYMALSNFAADTRMEDPEAFCNIGNTATSIDPWSGSFNLEMGLLPGSNNPHFVDNAMVIQVRGSGPMELDFMGINYGEESEAEDGVFISSNGRDWEQVYGPWSAQVPSGSRWYSATGIDLSSTTVNTAGVFYLAFRQLDNFPFGGPDGIGIDDIRIHPTLYPTLTVSNLYGGQTTEVKISSGTPNSLASIVLSASGSGPTLSIVGDLAVASDFLVLATAQLDAGGDLSHPVPLLPGFTGLRVWLDGIDWGTLSSTTDLDVRVR